LDRERKSLERQLAELQDRIIHGDVVTAPF